MKKKFLFPTIIGLTVIAGYAAGNIVSITRIKSFIDKPDSHFFLTDKYKSRTAVHKLLKIKSTDYVFVGNSITENFEWYEYFNDIKYKNRGIGSDVISGVINRLDNIQSSRKLFSLIGINDIIRDISVEEMEHNYEELIDHIINEKKTQQLYVVSILPIRGKLERFNSKILKVNQKIKNICQKKGIIYIDAHSQFIDPDGLLRNDFSVDGVHLTGAGYEKICNVLKPYLQ